MVVQRAQQGRLADAPAAAALGVAQHHQLAAPQDQADQQGVGLAARQARLWPHALGEQRQDLRVQPVGLGQEAGGTGEVADLARIDHGCGDARPAQGRDQGALEPAGGLDHQQRPLAAGQPGHQAADAGGGVGEAGAGAFRQQMHVELPLADIDAAEACEYCEAHGQAILVCGLAARSTVRFTDKVRTGAALTRDLPRPRTHRRPVRRPCPGSCRDKANSPRQSPQSPRFGRYARTRFSLSDACADPRTLLTTSPTLTRPSCTTRP